MGVVDKPIRRLPSHLHSPKLKEVPKVLPQVTSFQFTSLPFGLATAPQVFTVIVKEVELMALTSGISLHQYLDDWVIRPSLRKKHNKHSDSGRPNPVLRLGNKSGEVRTKPTQVFSLVGYEFHLDSALVKPSQERWLKFHHLFLRLKSNMILTTRCLMSLIGLLASTEKMVPEGRLHMRPFQFHLKEHWRFPQSLDSLLPWTETFSAHLEWWQNPTNVMKGTDLHPKDHSIQLFTDTSNEGWGAHLEHTSTKGLWSDRVLRLQGPVLNPNSVGCYRQLNNNSLHT